MRGVNFGIVIQTGGYDAITVGRIDVMKHFVGANAAGRHGFVEAFVIIGENFPVAESEVGLALPVEFWPAVDLTFDAREIIATSDQLADGGSNWIRESRNAAFIVVDRVPDRVWSCLQSEDPYITMMCQRRSSEGAVEAL